MKYFGSKLYGDLELAASENSVAILVNTPSHLILEAKQVWSWLAFWWEKYQKTMKSSKLEITQGVGYSVLSLIILGNSRAGQSLCDFDFFFNFYFMAHDSKFFCKCVHRLSSRQACLYHAELLNWIVWLVFSLVVLNVLIPNTLWLSFFH